MDLSTVGKSLENDAYNSLNDFIEDIRLIFKNSKEFNTNPMSRVLDMTHKLEDFFEKRIDTLIHPLDTFETDKMFFGRTEVSEDQNPKSFHTVNEGIEPFICKMCNARFARKAHLIGHISSNHEGKKPFQCNTCDATFARNSKLKVHIASVHEGKKPFQCTICNSFFTNKNNLKRHISSVHEEKKPYQCNTCDASFAQNSPLKRHNSSVHEGKKIF